MRIRRGMESSSIRREESSISRWHRGIGWGIGWGRDRGGDRHRSISRESSIRGIRSESRSISRDRESSIRRRIRSISSIRRESRSISSIRRHGC
jgi:hypothetical protein